MEKKKKKGQGSVLGGGKKPTLAKVPRVTENQLPQLEQLQTKAASAFQQPSQDSGNCKTKAHYEVIASNKPIKDKAINPILVYKSDSHTSVWKPFTLLIIKDLR